MAVLSPSTPMPRQLGLAAFPTCFLISRPQPSLLAVNRLVWRPTGAGGGDATPMLVDDAHASQSGTLPSMVQQLHLHAEDAAVVPGSPPQDQPAAAPGEGEAEAATSQPGLEAGRSDGGAPDGATEAAAAADAQAPPAPEKGISAAMTARLTHELRQNLHVSSLAAKVNMLLLLKRIAAEQPAGRRGAEDRAITSAATARLQVVVVEVGEPVPAVGSCAGCQASSSESEDDGRLRAAQAPAAGTCASPACLSRLLGVAAAKERGGRCRERIPVGMRSTHP